MAYDAATGTVVMFGGTDGGGNLLGDTWLWNGTSWSQVSSPFSPSPRSGASMAYDAAHGTVVLFGGSTASGAVNETWAWNGTSWGQQDFTSAPTPRTSAAMAYDGQTGTIVLFGGSSNSGLMGDTWTWNGNDWMQQTPATSPSSRAFANLAYYAPGGSMVLFGGFDSVAVDGDTWTWNGSNWAQAAPAVNPPARYLSAMDYDANSGTIQMFGGVSTSGAVNDTWAWNGTSWSQQNFASAPAARVQHGMVYDAATGKMVLFGGQNQSVDGGNVRLGDTWNLSLGSVNLGTVAVGQNSTFPVYFTVGSAGTLGSPLALTAGAQGLDFTLGAGSTCTGALSAGQSCSVNVVFTPQYAGTRMGAVELTSSTGGVIATTMLQGTGSGAQIAFSPGLMTTVAGNGVQGYVSAQTVNAQDGGAALSAQLYNPYGVALDGAGNLYIADYLNQRVRKVTPAGIITTVAGTGYRAFSSLNGDGGAATSTALMDPLGVAVDGAGNLYIVEYGGQRVRMVNAATGLISTVAGNGFQGYVAAQDGGPATSASLYNPSGIAIDGAGNLYIADYQNQRIRKVNLVSGIISTIAGNGSQGYIAAQDGGPATSASLSSPIGITVDGAGNVYFADYGNQRIRKVTAATGIITTVAGNGTSGYSAAQDGGPATSASLANPLGVAVDGAGDLFISDTGNQRIRKVNGATGAISSVAGTGISGYVVSQDGGLSTNAQLGGPLGLALDGVGNLYIAESGNARIRKILARGTMIFPTATAVGNVDGTDGTQTLTMSNIGNLPLSISAMSTSSVNYNLNNPSLGGCSTSIAVAAGDSCVLGTQFTPQSGSGVLIGTLNITDNVPALTALPAPVLSGATTAGSMFFSIAPVTGLTTVSTKLSVIVGYGGASVPTGAMTVMVNGSTAGVGTPSCVLKGGHQNCSVPFTPTGLNAGTYPISVTKAGDANYATFTGTGVLKLLWGAVAVGDPIAIGTPLPDQPVTATPITAMPITATPVTASPITATPVNVSSANLQ